MESFTLDRNNKIKEFEFNSKDSYLLIKSVSLFLEENNNISWIKLLPIIQLKAELKYIVYKDNNERFSDERMIQFPIYLLLDINQTHPIFNINQKIQNDILKIGLNTDDKDYSTLKIELTESHQIMQNYSLQLTVDKYKMA